MIVLNTELFLKIASLSDHANLSSSVALLLFLLPLPVGPELPSAAPDISSYVPIDLIMLPVCFRCGCSCSAVLNLLLVVLPGSNTLQDFYNGLLF